MRGRGLGQGILTVLQSSVKYKVSGSSCIPPIITTAFSVFFRTYSLLQSIQSSLLSIHTQSFQASDQLPLFPSTYLSINPPPAIRQKQPLPPATSTPDPSYFTMSGELVPQGYWFCCACQQPNQIALAPDECSNCTHKRNTCCKKAGDPKPLPIKSSDTPLFDGPSVSGLVDSFPGVGGYQLSAHGYDPHSGSVTTLSGAGSPAQGSWICKECNASNSNLTDTFCPICGHQR